MNTFTDFPETYFPFVALAEQALHCPHRFEWTKQGFGMYRAKLDPFGIARVHIWCDKAVTPEATAIHDHPWDFYSLVMHGEIVNTKYKNGHSNLLRERYTSHLIRCGEGAAVECSTNTCLTQTVFQHLGSGAGYFMRAEELHQTKFKDGTITLIVRNCTQASPDFAHSYSKGWDSPWVSAAPVPVSPEEVIEAWLNSQVAEEYCRQHRLESLIKQANFGDSLSAPLPSADSFPQTLGAPDPSVTCPTG